MSRKISDGGNARLWVTLGVAKRFIMRAGLSRYGYACHGISEDKAHGVHRSIVGWVT